MGLLWPDYPEQTARNNLRQALFKLRLAIGDHTASPPYLLISGDTIQFNRASDFSLDLAQFNAIFFTCEENQSRCIEDCSIPAARLEEIVKLYRGEFLQHLFVEDSAEFEEWALVQRESLRQHVLDACSELANYYELHGNFPAARRHALRQLELDPWREEAHCQVMRALALDGQRGAALAQYETCRRVLAEELGVEPSARTRELVEGQKLLADQPAGTLTTTAVFYDTLRHDIRKSFRHVVECVERVERIYDADSAHARVAKSVAVLQLLDDFPTNRENIAALLHPSADAGSQLATVKAAVDEMLADKEVHLSEIDGRLRFMSEPVSEMEGERAKIHAGPRETRLQLHEKLKQIFTPALTVRLLGTRSVTTGIKGMSGTLAIALDGELEPVQTVIELVPAGSYGAAATASP